MPVNLAGWGLVFLVFLDGFLRLGVLTKNNLTTSPVVASIGSMNFGSQPNKNNKMLQNNFTV